MAELRANTMHNTISTNFSQSKRAVVVVTAKKKPIKANGMANMVCAKVTRDKYFFITNINSPPDRGRDVFYNMLIK